MTVEGDPIAAWLVDPDPSTFPYDAVLAAYLRVGKHFVAEDLLKNLSLARDRLYDLNLDTTPEWTVLMRFLGVALDKFDERYNYPTYIAVDVLDLAGVAVAAEDEHPWAARDRLFAGLAADTLRFELDAMDGRTDLLPELRPDGSVVAKRCRLTMHAVCPALSRLGLAGPLTGAEMIAAARQLPAIVAAGQSKLDQRVLQLSMLPVYVYHDEHLFIRVLQMFETTFAMMAGQLKRAVRVLLESADWAAAARCMNGCTQAMRESAPLFSLLATMQVESFRTFRDYTEGASAIQSRNYKTVESLCAVPESSRLDSMAYHSVPEVRARVLAGRPTIDEALRAACEAGRIPPAGEDALNHAMGGFAEALLRWRQTHYRLAVRMLGERSGTGYTQGTPYLKSVRRIPVFRTTGDPKEVESDERTAVAAG